MSKCSFLEIDHLTFQEKINWIDRLRDDRIEAILEYHQLCTQD